MSNDNPGTKEISLGCYQGIRSERPAIWKDYFAVQTIDIPVVGKGTKRVEYTCQFCAEKVELTIRSTRIQSLSCLGIILVLASAVGFIYWGNQIQIWGNPNTVTLSMLYCLAIVIGMLVAGPVTRRLEGISVSQTSTYESNKVKDVRQPKHKILRWEESNPVSGHRAYLVPLWGTSEWSSSEMNELVATIQSELRCPIYLLKAVQVKGEFPRSADDYVVATALLACESVGVDLNEKDVISFRGGEYSPSVNLGVIIIEIKYGAHGE